MSQERLYQTEAIVVRRRDQGEADRVLTLCTPLGKLSVIAKGVRKVRSRKAGHLELFAHVRLILARSRSSWDVISQAEMVKAYAPLRQDLILGTYARYVMEIYDRFVAEGEGGQAVFDLLRQTLDHLSLLGAGTETRGVGLLLLRAYEQRLLGLAGFRPEWGHCVGERDGNPCHRPLKAEGEEAFGLDPERGGALCPDCFQARRDQYAVMPLSPAAVGLLRACQREPFARLRERQATPALLIETEQAMRRYISYHLEQEIRTGTFLRRLRRERLK